MLKILSNTLFEVEIDTLVDTLVKRQARVELKSLENRQRGAARHIGC